MDGNSNSSTNYSNSNKLNKFIIINLKSLCKCFNPYDLIVLEDVYEKFQNNCRCFAIFGVGTL